MSADKSSGPEPVRFPGDEARAQRLAVDHEKQVLERLEEFRIRREAERRLDAEERGVLTLPTGVLLHEWLAQAEPSLRWRIEGLQPEQTRVMLAAPAKTGKSTIVIELIRALLEGGRFLERYPVFPIPGRVALLDFEMAPRQHRQWFRLQRLQRADQVVVWSLRGHAGTFDPRDPENRAMWAQQLRTREVRYLIIDCLRPIFDALAIDEHTEVGPMLTSIDALLVEAGVPEALIVHHMGHGAERARGDSRLIDWPDVSWLLVRQNEEPSSPRFFKAYGRDVDVRESRLVFDDSSRRLTLSDGSRRDETTRAALEAVTAVLTDATEWMSGRDLEKACKPHVRSAVRAAIEAGTKKQLILTKPGMRNAVLHWLASRDEKKGKAPKARELASAPQSAESAPAHSSAVSVSVRRRLKKARTTHSTPPTAGRSDALARSEAEVSPARGETPAPRTIPRRRGKELSKPAAGEDSPSS